MEPESQAFSSASKPKFIHTEAIDGQGLKQLTAAGLNWLRANQQTVNALNVFPVPDGDTGTNMVLTMQAAYDEIANSSEQNTGRMAHALAHGALMGARGNSGVILSQIWRGFARALDSQEILDGPSLVRAFNQGKDTAYKGVVRPVEGTILTVVKDVASTAEQTLQETQDPHEILARIVLAADQSVAHTPELLHVLKEAGVVDSGGKGLFFILEGMLRYIQGQSLEAPAATVQPLAAMKLEETRSSVEPGQDFEVVTDFRPHQPLDLEAFYQDLEKMGTSIQLGEGDGIYRLHIHVPTQQKYTPIDYLEKMGVVYRTTIENLNAQIEELETKAEASPLNLAQIEPGQIGVVAVAPGPGIARVFASLGVAGIVEGGQTMNPSTREILTTFEKLPSDKIIILPNNKNIIMAARNAAKLTTKKVGVVPSRSVPQGMAAMMRLAPDGDFDTVLQDMSNAITEVQTGEITTATRSVEIDGVTVQQGQIIALLDGNLVLSATALSEACLSLLKTAMAEDFELITLFYGSNVDRSEVDRIAEAIKRAYPNQQVEVLEGGQPYYQFIISIE